MKVKIRHVIADMRRSANEHDRDAVRASNGLSKRMWEARAGDLRRYADRLEGIVREDSP